MKGAGNVVAKDLPTYAVISPVRDEAHNLARTAESMVAQSHRPLQWVIVDDGSTDGSRALAEAYAATHDWISVVDSGHSHDRARGAPIVRAFDVGRSTLDERPEITVKMDADLFLPAHYFEWIGETFAREPKAGVVGGVVLIHDGERWRLDGKSPHVRGVVKSYRTRCLEDIGGLRPSVGWDGIDEYAARARGWQVHVLSELCVLHYDQRGSKQPWYQARWEEGSGSYYMGYLPQFLLVRAFYRMVSEHPPVLGGLVIAAAYFYGHLRSLPQVEDPESRRVLRQDQSARLRGLLRGRPNKTCPPLPGGGPAFWAGRTALRVLGHHPSANPSAEPTARPRRPSLRSS